MDNAYRVVFTKVVGYEDEQHLAIELIDNPASLALAQKIKEKADLPKEFVESIDSWLRTAVPGDVLTIPAFVSDPAPAYTLMKLAAPAKIRHLVAETVTVTKVATELRASPPNVKRPKTAARRLSRKAT